MDIEVVSTTDEATIDIFVHLSHIPAPPFLYGRFLCENCCVNRYIQRLVMLDHFPTMAYQFTYSLTMVQRNCFLAITYPSICLPKISYSNPQISPLEYPGGVQLVPSWPTHTHLWNRNDTFFQNYRGLRFHYLLKMAFIQMQWTLSSETTGREEL